MFLIFPRSMGACRMQVPLAFSVSAMALFTGVAQAQHDHAVPAVTTASSASATTASAPPIASGSPMPLQFDSVLSRYKPMTDQKLSPWREANDTVTRIGGWRTYLKESQTPDTTAPASPAAPNAPTAPTRTTNPHLGHGAKP